MGMKCVVAGVAIVALTGLPVAVCLGQAWRTTERVNVSSLGAQGNGRSDGVSISADGRFVAFASLASNLVPADTNGKFDAFVRDRLLSTTERVSVSSLGEQGNGESQSPSISADGRFVAFQSAASNLVPGDSNLQQDIFVRDRLLGTTELVSVSSLGEQGNRYGHAPSISTDGRFVAFHSSASNLVPGDTNIQGDVFVRDRLLGTTERVSVSSLGEQGNGNSDLPAISTDGRFVAFRSYATNLVPGDTNSYDDVFVRDRQLGTTERVSVSYSGEQGNGRSEMASISADGRFVAFSSTAPNLVPADMNEGRDVFVRDLLLGSTERVSLSSHGVEADGGSSQPGISADGRFVVFQSIASNLAPGDTNSYDDVFVRDLLLGTTQRVSLSSNGVQGNGHSFSACISTDGRVVAFQSIASNLVPGDTNGTTDVFVAERSEGRRVSGQVRFGHLGAGSLPPTWVQMRITEDGANPTHVAVELGPNGEYSLVLGSWPYELSLKHTHWLRRTIVVDLTASDVENANFYLENGDAYADNAVGVKDLNKVLYLFGEQDWLADLDEDGLVALSDLTIVMVNFGLAGDP